MHDAVAGLAAPDQGKDVAAADADDGQRYTPAVSVRKSLASPDKIISMIDGKPYSTLRRHLTANGLTPEEYRQRYGLKTDYPMVAPGYSASRSEHAKRLGLGRKPGQTLKGSGAAADKGTIAPDQPKKRGRKSISEAKAAAAAHLGSKG